MSQAQNRPAITPEQIERISSEIRFDIDGNVIHNIQFKDGCSGNLRAVSTLCEGMTVEEIEEKLGPVRCSRKRTSCAHQLSLAVREAYNAVQAAEAAAAKGKGETV